MTTTPLVLHVLLGTTREMTRAVEPMTAIEGEVTEDDHRRFTACCLEWDLVADAETAPQALSDVDDLIRCQYDSSRRHGDFQCLFVPAPQALWAMATHARVTGSRPLDLRYMDDHDTLPSLGLLATGVTVQVIVTDDAATLIAPPSHDDTARP